MNAVEVVASVAIIAAEIFMIICVRILYVLFAPNSIIQYYSVLLIVEDLLCHFYLSKKCKRQPLQVPFILELIYFILD